MFGNGTIRNIHFCAFEFHDERPTKSFKMSAGKRGRNSNPQSKRALSSTVEPPEGRIRFVRFPFSGNNDEYLRSAENPNGVAFDNEFPKLFYITLVPRILHKLK